LIDEAQFIPQLARLCDELERRAVGVVLAALNQDFKGQPWPEITPLLHTFEVEQTFAVCKHCGDMRSTYSHLVSDAKPDAQGHIIGAEEHFIALCRACWLQQQSLGTQHMVLE
jgi:thymidine kinase